MRAKLAGDSLSHQDIDNCLELLVYASYNIGCQGRVLVVSPVRYVTGICCWILLIQVSVFSCCLLQDFQHARQVIR